MSHVFGFSEIIAAGPVGVLNASLLGGGDAVCTTCGSADRYGDQQLVTV